jgi:hypothetical protein
MMLLYWRPRRYYVEHLLFLLHNHIFVFIGYGLLLLLGLALPDNNVVGLVVFVFHIYLLWYLYRSMRTVYGQSSIRTAAKYLVLGAVYFVTGTLMMLVTALFSVAML